MLATLRSSESCRRGRGGDIGGQTEDQGPASKSLVGGRYGKLPDNRCVYSDRDCCNCCCPARDSQFPSLTVVYADAHSCSAGVPPLSGWAAPPPGGRRRPRASRQDAGATKTDPPPTHVGPDALVRVVERSSTMQHDSSLTPGTCALDRTVIFEALQHERGRSRPHLLLPPTFP